MLFLLLEKSKEWRQTRRNHMFNRLFKKKAKKEISIVAPVSGRVIPLEQVPDPVFSQKLAGDGIAIQPSDGVLVAPFDGKVSHLFHTNHAISLQSDAGLEILIHIGIDTVKLNGQGFDSFVKTGDQVKTGDVLVTFDLPALEAAGCPTVTPVLITDEKQVAEKKFSLGAVTAGKEEIIRVVLA
jgi:PTS system glucose-specific IIA component